jgi:hypothetical protein
MTYIQEALDSSGAVISLMVVEILYKYVGHLMYSLAVAFLGAFAKWRKATVRFVTPVRPSARNNSASTERIFLKLNI